ncbi:OFA family MFS transporter [Moritella marina ATCC 15381]|uniref:OFA family MFS transporter n=1 Tax=Moritella marina ATCC 15381 TaxID=1202962 RepID=A0A5J6WGJ9_MORMI|nr:OFA family MFS transporter [Moritella marina]QFI37173.1 OFA family MFS transporter [Moritella marina ATCC 15381]
MSNKPLQILLAGIGINLTIGILYAWGVFTVPLAEALNVTATDVKSPYKIAVFTFATCLLIAGILQDKIGPKKVTMLGVTLVGLGLIASGYTTTLTQLEFTFGGIVGAGIGFAYACISPSAMKWWPKGKKGLVSGLTAGGFGLASVYLAPLSTSLIESYGIYDTFKILGAGLLAIAIPLASLLVAPPAGYVADASETTAAASSDDINLTWQQMLKTRQFYQLWVMFMVSAAAGIMLIGSVGNISQSIGLTPEQIAFSVVLLAIFNTGGRVVGGLISDKIGRINTLALVFMMQAANMAFFTTITTQIPLMIAIAVGAMSYGALLSVFPTITADNYGLKTYGTNFGILYSSWGVSGFFGGFLATVAGSTNNTYFAFAALLVLVTVIAFFTKPVDKAAVLAKEEGKLKAAKA